MTEISGVFSTASKAKTECFILIIPDLLHPHDPMFLYHGKHDTIWHQTAVKCTFPHHLHHNWGNGKLQSHSTATSQTNWWNTKDWKTTTHRRCHPHEKKVRIYLTFSFIFCRHVTNERKCRVTTTTASWVPSACPGAPTHLLYRLNTLQLHPKKRLLIS